MRVLLDTNIVLDYLGANQGFTEDAEKVFDLTAKRKDTPITRNKGDFEEDAIPCYSPQEFLEKYLAEVFV